MRHLRRVGTTRFAAAVLSVLLSAASAEGPISERLRRPVRVDKPPGPLFEVLESVASAQGLAVQIDPRVDRRAPVIAPADEMPTVDLLNRIAAQADAAVRPLGQTVLVVPAADGDRVATLALLRESELAGRRDGRSIALFTPIDVRPLEATPAELLDDVLGRALLRLEGGPAAEQLPYDLWRVDLRGVTVSEALAFVLVPCGRSFEWSDDGVRVVPLPEQIEAEQQVTVPGGGRATPQVLRKVRAAVPGATFEPRGRSVLVRGSASQIESARDALRPPAEASGGGKRYTLKVDRRPAGKVVEALAERGVPVAVEGDLPAATITIDLREATLGEVAEAIAEQWTGVAAAVEGETAIFRLERADP